MKIIVAFEPLLIDDVHAAILNRRRIAFSCGAAHHEISPHALGTRLGIWCVYGWDSTTSPHGWRCIELRTITSSISICDGEWQSVAHAPHAKSSCLHFVYAEVDPPHDPLPPWARHGPDDQDLS